MREGGGEEKEEAVFLWLHLTSYSGQEYLFFLTPSSEIAEAVLISIEDLWTRLEFVFRVILCVGGYDELEEVADVWGREITWTCK